MANPIPSAANIVNLVTAPLTSGNIRKGETLFIPTQIPGTSPSVDKAAQALLRSLLPSGHEGYGQNLVMVNTFNMLAWKPNLHQNWSEVVALLEQHGYKVQKVAVTAEEFWQHKPPVDMPVGNQPIYGPLSQGMGKTESPAALYGRVRFLWKNHNGVFTPFEADFVKSVGATLGKGRILSPKQLDVLNRILVKYRVPSSAIAVILARLEE